MTGRSVGWKEGEAADAAISFYGMKRRRKKGFFTRRSFFSLPQGSSRFPQPPPPQSPYPLQHRVGDLNGML